MPCGPVVPGPKARSGETIIDPFSYSQASALMQGWANMAIMFSAPLRAAMIVAGEAVRSPGTDRD